MTSDKGSPIVGWFVQPATTGGRGWGAGRWAVFMVVGACLGANAMAQTAEAGAPLVPRNTVQLSVSAQRQVPQDWLTMTLVVRKESADPQSVQAQLKLALDQAIAQARPALQPGLVEMRSGAFSVYPRYSREGKVTGWQGQAEWLLEGRDIARIGALAGQMNGMVVQGLAFSLSRESARRLESEVQAEAVAKFRAKAGELAKAFGFAGYQLREVTVGSVDAPMEPMRPRALAMEAKATMADAPVPVEPGKTEVQVSVSGSVQLQ
jgi:predicted secreted protein